LRGDRFPKRKGDATANKKKGREGRHSHLKSSRTCLHAAILKQNEALSENLSAAVAERGGAKLAIILWALKHPDGVGGKKKMKRLVKKNEGKTCDSEEN